MAKQAICLTSLKIKKRMEKNRISDQIESFWDWFGNNQPLLENVISENGHPKTEYIIQSLDQHILGMGKIKWEIGNPQPNQFSFTLSPNNDRDLLKITKSIIAAAPKVATWTFYYAAQVTKQLQIQVYDHNMDVQDVDASSWKAVLLPSELGKHELVLETANIEYLDEDTRMIAADLILTAILGEEEKINRLAGLELVFEMDSVDRENSFPIANLPFNLES